VNISWLLSVVTQLKSHPEETELRLGDRGVERGGESQRERHARVHRVDDPVVPEARGRAFGFHRFGDTLGVIVGPLLAVALISSEGSVLETSRTLS